MSEVTQDLVDALDQAAEQVETGAIEQLIILGVGPGPDGLLFKLAGTLDERNALIAVGAMDLVKRKLFDLQQAIDAEMIAATLGADEHMAQ